MRAERQPFTLCDRVAFRSCIRLEVLPADEPHQHGQVDLQQRRMDGALMKDLMEEYNLSKVSVYRYLDDITVELTSLSKNGQHPH